MPRVPDCLLSRGEEGRHVAHVGHLLVRQLGARAKLFVLDGEVHRSLGLGALLGLAPLLGLGLLLVAGGCVLGRRGLGVRAELLELGGQQRLAPALQKVELGRGLPLVGHQAGLLAGRPAASVRLNIKAIHQTNGIVGCLAGMLRHNTVPVPRSVSVPGGPGVHAGLAAELGLEAADPQLGGAAQHALQLVTGHLPHQQLIYGIILCRFARFPKEGWPRNTL